MGEYQVDLGMDGESKKGTLSEMLEEPLPYAQDAFLACLFMVYVTINHWTKTYVPTTLGIQWVCIGNVLKTANLLGLIRCHLHTQWIPK